MEDGLEFKPYADGLMGERSNRGSPMDAKREISGWKWCTFNSSLKIELSGIDGGI